MRIENDGLVQRIAQVFNAGQLQRTQPAPSSNPGPDRVTLSAKAAQIRAVHQALSGDEPVRTQRVAELKTAIQNGTYQVPAQAIAKKMLAELNRLGE